MARREPEPCRVSTSRHEFQIPSVRDASRELAMSVSLDADWGGTGSSAIDAESFTTLTPTLFLGKGLASCRRRYSSRSRSRPSSAMRFDQKLD